MTDDKEFTEAVNKLTRETSKFLLRDSGLSKHTGDGLLQQLWEAVFGGMEGGNGSAFGSRAPIDASALDLLEEITAQASQALAQVDTRPTPFGHAEEYVRLWAAAASPGQVYRVTRRAVTSEGKVFDEQIELTGVRLVNRWVQRIEEFFIPPPPPQAIPNPCPQCETRYVHRFKDGEVIQQAALQIIRDKDTGKPLEARCMNEGCGISWPPSRFPHLAATLGYPPIPEMAGDTP